MLKQYCMPVGFGPNSWNSIHVLTPHDQGFTLIKKQVALEEMMRITCMAKISINVLIQQLGITSGFPDYGFPA